MLKKNPRIKVDKAPKIVERIFKSEGNTCVLCKKRINHNFGIDLCSKCLNGGKRKWGI